MRSLTLIRDKNLQTGIAGSLAVHCVLVLLLAWGFGMKAVEQWTQRAQNVVPVEKEVTLLFPDLIIPPPPAPLPTAEPPPKPALKAFIRSTQTEDAPKAAANPRFASDRNTVAASQKAPSPDASVNMPSTDGIALRTQDLANRDFQDGELKPAGAPKALALPQMLPPEATAPSDSPIEVAKAGKSLPKMIEEADQDAAHVEIRRPAAKARGASDATPGSPKAGFTAETRTSIIRGTITTRGENAVDAERTPMGVYMRGVTGAVEKKWHVYRMQNKDAVSFGSLRVRFFVKTNGNIEDLQIISDRRDADPRLVDFTLRAIKDAEIPPIPADLLPVLEGERVKIEYDVLIY